MIADPLGCLDRANSDSLVSSEEGRDMTGLFWLSDAQLNRVEPRLPKNNHGLKRVDDCRVPSGIVHMLKTDFRWCDLPS